MPLASVIGRAVDIENDFRARVRLHTDWAGRIPDVFTDVHAHVYAVDQKEGRLVPGLEVAILIEDAVVGQVMFVIDSNQLPFVDHGGGVVDVMHAIDKTNYRGQARQIAAGYDQSLQRGLVV